MGGNTARQHCEPTTSSSLEHPERFHVPDRRSPWRQSNARCQDFTAVSHYVVTHHELQPPFTRGYAATLPASPLFNLPSPRFTPSITKRVGEFGDPPSSQARERATREFRYVGSQNRRERASRAIRLSKLQERNHPPPICSVKAVAAPKLKRELPQCARSKPSRMPWCNCSS